MEETLTAVTVPSYDEYVRARSGHLFRTAFLLTGQHAEAEDLLQSVLVKLYVRWDRLSRAEALDAYARRMLVNEFVSSRRPLRVRRERVVEDPPEQGAGEASPDDRLTLRPHVVALPPRQRAVLVLRYWEHLTEREIAELSSVVAAVAEPTLDVAALEAAGRRAHARSRSLAALAVAAAVALVVGLVLVVPRSGPDQVAPSDRGVATDGANDLGRPLQLPWWGSDDRTLHTPDGDITVGGVTALQYGGGVTLVRTGEESWSVDEGDGSLRPLPASLVAPPVVGVDGSLAYVVVDANLAWTLTWEAGDGVHSLVGTGYYPSVVGVDDGRVLTTVGNELSVWRADQDRLEPVTGLPGGLTSNEFGNRPGGVGVEGADGFMAGRVSGTRYRSEWTTPVLGSWGGGFSPDGTTLAVLRGRNLAIATEEGLDELAEAFPSAGTYVVGWEDDDVVVADWVRRDGAVVGLWRCSSLRLACIELDGPNGRVVVPGLPLY